jgi:hypothetical protein
MDASPLVVVADAKVFYQRLIVCMFHGYCQRLLSVSRSNDTAIAVGLFLVGVALLDNAMVEATEFLIPLNRAEIGCLE